jgi:hypothetical protein
MGAITETIIVAFFGGMMKFFVVVMSSPTVGTNVGHSLLTPSGYQKQGNIVKSSFIFTLELTPLKGELIKG